jgi:hypothetical protein
MILEDERRACELADVISKSSSKIRNLNLGAMYSFPGMCQILLRFKLSAAYSRNELPHQVLAIALYTSDFDIEPNAITSAQIILKLISILQKKSVTPPANLEERANQHIATAEVGTE